MKGPDPKPPELRQRTNKASTNSVLVTDKKVRAPKLPKEIEWHSMTKRWWLHIWRSPMASEWLESDIDALFVLADLHNRYWHIPHPALASEIRMQEARFGLTPLDRWRLQWKIEKQEDKPRQVEPEIEEEDPRSALRLVQ